MTKSKSVKTINFEIIGATEAYPSAYTYSVITKFTDGSTQERRTDHDEMVKLAKLHYSILDDETIKWVNDSIRSYYEYRPDELMAKDELLIYPKTDTSAKSSWLGRNLFQPAHDPKPESQESNHSNSKCCAIM